MEGANISENLAKNYQITNFSITNVLSNVKQCTVLFCTLVILYLLTSMVHSDLRGHLTSLNQHANTQKLCTLNLGIVVYLNF